MQREWFDKNYYAELGVKPDASPKDITTAYRKLAREFHPDANPGNTVAEERFKQISSAYDVVGDPQKRLEYDKVREMGPMGAARGPGGPGGPGGFSNMGAAFRDADMGDLLGNLFGRGRSQGHGPGGPFSAGPQHGTDLEADLHLSFIDAVKGVTTSVNLISEAKCGDCSGSGAAMGTTARVCPDCAGRGVMDDNQEFFSFSRPCTTCSGRGTYVDTPCMLCGGSGVTTRPRVVKVKLPIGVKDGQQIRLRGKGAPGRNNGPPGDLYVRVHVEPHPVYSRDGDDLCQHVPITFTEAALGADISVPTIDGDTVKIRLPSGTPTGRTFRVKARGVEGKEGRGDMLVTVDVAVPSTLTDSERSALEQLAAVTEHSPRDE